VHCVRDGITDTADEMCADAGTNTADNGGAPAGAGTEYFASTDISYVSRSPNRSPKSKACRDVDTA
jgi:hypothetical protein